jgi:lipopolysaccharide export system protein LptC
MNRVGSFFPLIIAALLAAATFWLEQVVRNESHGNLGNTRHDPDLVAQHVSIDRYDATGKRITRITATQLQHYPDNDTADVTSPVVTMTRDARPTVFTSTFARVYNETKVVIMSGNVHGNRAATGDSPAFNLTTEELKVLTDDEIASSEQPVAITHGTASMTGVGMEWNNITGLFSIKSLSRSTFPPRTTH